MRDPKTGSDSLVKFPMESGLAGYCTVAGHTILVENIKGDVRFVQEVDDPGWSVHSPTQQIISCPINARDDYAMISKDANMSLPRCIVQIVNKVGVDRSTRSSTSDAIQDLLRQGNVFN